MRFFSVLGPSVISGALCVALACGGASAAPATNSDEVEISNVVVSATRTERDLMEVPASVSVVTEKEIRRKAFTSIADMLQDVPGVEVFDQSLAGAKRISIRGDSGARVLILIDGQKISEQKSMDGAPLLIDPDMIERIEVIKGPASVLYGSEAIGGAVNIITKKGGEKPVQGSANLIFDSSTDGFTGSAAFYGGVKAFHYRFSGTRSDQGDRRTPDETLHGSESDMTAFNGFLGYEGKRFSIGIGAEDYDSEVDSPATEVSGVPFDLNLPEWSRQKANFFVDAKQLSPLVPRLRFDAYYQETKKDFEQVMTIDMGTVMGTYEQRIETYNEQSTTGASLQADILPGEKQYLIAGYSFSHDTLDADTATGLEYVSGGMMGPMDLGSSAYFHEACITTHAVYLQDEWMLPADLKLTVGGRQTWVESELEDTDDDSASKGSVDDNQAVFSAGLTWSGVDALSLRALLSQGYRFPDLNKLFVGTSHGGTVTLANPDLDSETSDNMEIGARFNNERLKIDITAFFSQADNYLTTESAGDDIYQFANVDKAETKGVEAALSYTFPIVGLTPYLSGTWMKRKYEEADFSTWKTNTPAWLGRAGVKGESDLGTWPATLWADLWMRAATDADEKSSDGTLTTSESWQTLNLALGGEFGARRQYRLTLNLNNLFDQSYRTAQNSLDEPGFHAVVRAGVTF